uniref:Uncharacterized protein n=1 Tax=Oryza meridionalis TaxID=40149 RepID=A0A0E0F1F4_9ORYZ
MHEEEKQYSKSSGLKGHSVKMRDGEKSPRDKIQMKYEEVRRSIVEEEKDPELGIIVRGKGKYSY